MKYIMFDIFFNSVSIYLFRKPAEFKKNQSVVLININN